VKKKSLGYLAKKAAKRKAAQEARTQSPIPSGNSPKEYPRWIRVAKWIVGTMIVGSVGFVASVYQISGGPPWPTDPVFSLQPPSSASPFDTPFDVANKSGLFEIRELSIHCEIRFLKSKRMTVTRDFRGKLLFPSRGPNPTLAAGTVSAFTCPFREALDRNGFGAGALDEPSEAQILIVGTHEMPWWRHGFWANPHRETPAVFTLDVKTIPPRWVAGVPLK